MPPRTKSGRVGTRARRANAADVRSYEVSGIVWHAGGRIPARGGRVTAFDRDIGDEQALGEAATDDNGRYSIAYSDARFRRTATKLGGADLFVRAVDAAGLAVGESQVHRNAGAKTQIDVELGEGVFFARGTAVDASGLPVSGIVVRAFDRDLRAEEPLGETVTGSDGRFEIRYTTSRFTRAEKDRADLVVRLYTRADAPSAAVTSETMFNAPASVDFRLTVPEAATGSEYERYVAALTPVLDRVLLSELREDEEHQDFTFLVSETGIPRERLELLARGARESLVVTGPMTHLMRAASRTDTMSSQAAQMWYGWLRQGLASDRDAVLNLPAATLMGALRDSIRERIIPEQPAELLQQLESALVSRDLAREVTPAVGGQPASLGNVLSLFPETLRLNDAQAATLAGLLRPAGPEDDPLTRIRTGSGLSAPQLAELQRAMALNHVAGGDVAVLTAAAAALPRGGRVSEAPPFAAIASLRADDWRAAFEDVGSVIPPGHTADTLARQLEARVASLMPSDFMMAASLRVPPASALTELLDGDGGGDEISMPLRRLANRFEGLGLAGVYAREDSATARAAEVERRMGLLQRVYQQNPETNLLALDYMPDGSATTALSLDGIRDDDRPIVLNVLKAHQRVHRLTADARQAERLLEGGYASARRIVEAGAERVLDDTGLSPFEVGEVMRRASEVTGGVAISMGYAIGVSQQLSLELLLGLGMFTLPTAATFFTRIPGFDELFGRQSVCRCRHCQSVLSPAAYFVDLMWFVERRITRPAFAARPTHPFKLRSRRGDLWTLKLNCQNTDQLVPTLDIVNDVLERYIGSLFRPALAAADVYARIALQAGSLQQPVNLPLERIGLLLGHFEKTRADVARALGDVGETYARARLGLSIPEWDLIVSSRETDTTFLTRLYGSDVTTNLSPAKEIDVQLLLARASWTRDALGELLERETVRADAAVDFQSKKASSESVQNDLEVITGVTAGVLDRLHRFRRLLAATGWSARRLDLVLATLAPGGSRMTASQLAEIARLLDVQPRLAADVDELCALFGPITRLAVDTRPSLFDRLFNLQPFVDQQGPWPPTTAPQFTHPAFVPSGASTPDNRTLQRLLAGLQISDADLVALLGGLGLASTTASTVALTEANLAVLYRHATVAKRLGLSVKELLALMRHAAVGHGTPRRLETPAHLTALVSAFDDWSASGYELDDVGFVLTGVPSTASHPRQDAMAGAALQRLSRERPFEFNDTILATVFGISEELSKRVVAFNTLVDPADSVQQRPFERGRQSSLLRLRAPVDPGATGWTINLPTDTTLPTGVTAVTLSALFRPYDPLVAVASALAPAMGIRRETLARLLPFCLDTANAPQPLGANRAAIVAALYGDDQVAFETAIFGTRRLLPRLLVLFNRPEWTAADLAALNDGLASTPPVPVVFEGRTAVALDWRAIVEAGTYARLARASIDDADPSSAASSPARLRAALAVSDYTQPGGDAALAAALRTDVLRVAAIRPSLAAGAAALRPVARLDRLRRVLEFAAAFGASGETLRQMVPQVAVPPFDPMTAAGYPAALEAAATSEYGSLSRAADALYGIIRTTYPDEKTFREKVEPYDDISRGRRRDALVEFLLRPAGVSSPLRFRSTSDLYAYFLIDVEISGCARTSPLVAAAASVQLYVQRVLMQLEGGLWSGVSTTVVQSALTLVARQWEWRKHYRVWEANRKVFLYPENYLEPDLRDDKTPLYADLEQQLVQQEVSEPAAANAYAQYLSGFETLARLQIAGVFHDVLRDPVKPRDTLHVLGMTNEDPPTYYYRTISQLRPNQPLIADPAALEYGAWRKLDVQIPAPYATPIVAFGRLHILWLEISTTPKNGLVNGESMFEGYVHRFKLKFSSLKADGTWTPPQDTEFHHDGLPMPQALYDLLDPPRRTSTPAATPSSGTSSGSNATTFQGTGVGVVVVLPGPTKFLGVAHTPLEAKEHYRLRGQVWTKVFAEVQELAPKTEPRVIFRAIGQDPSTQPSTSVGVYGQYGELDLFARTCNQASKPNAFGLVQKRLRMCAGGVEIQTYPAGYPAKFENHFSFSAVPLRQTDPGGTIVRYADVLGLSGAQPVNREGRRPISGGTLVAPLDAVFSAGRHTCLLRISAADSGSQASIVSIGTSLRDVLSRRLFSRGVPGLLEMTFQRDLEEDSLPLENRSASLLVQEKVRDPFANAFGTYYRELFFEIPYAVALALNGQQRFSAAQRWFHYIFDPTSTDTDADRVWRFRGFRGADITSLRSALTNSAAIDKYNDDPFGPHAVARVRPGAHQRAVVMRYVDNLLDWGDSLFTEFTMESLNEATMLYVLASDILGPQPPDIGDCGESAGEAHTYAYIEEHALTKGASEFLIELESMAPVEYFFESAHRRVFQRVRQEDGPPGAQPLMLARALGAEMSLGGIAGGGDMFAGLELDDTAPLWRSAGGRRMIPVDGEPAVDGGPLGSSDRTVRVFGARGPINPAGLSLTGTGDPRTTIFDNETLIPFDYGLPPKFTREPRLTRPERPEPGRNWFDRGFETPGVDLVEQASTKTAVFCVPPNTALLAYWDRVRDRLNKIRNCMDITGASRRPSLFGPEIDPALLVRLRAAGLSLDDAAAATTASVPPYRFAYMIERALQHVQTVQALSSALLAAMERKDAEELAHLRGVHEKNILVMRRRVAELEVESAEATAESLRRKRALLDYKRGFYAQLQAVGRIPEEQTEYTARSMSAGLRMQEAAFGILAGLLALIPNAGAPMAMTYGGVQVKGTAAGFLNALRSGGALADVIAEMAGREAAHERRMEEWRHQEQLVAREMLDVDRQIVAAEARAEIARRSLVIHERSMEQADELIAFYREKFTSHGLFTWLSTRLHRLHREAFNAALAVAQMAEQAFRFERVDDTAVRLAADYWDTQRAGLGAAERLLLDLRRLEQRFLETNFRTLEVEQSFSLAQLDPHALVELRATGACDFTIPEVAFDLAYPGHYRRRMKAVRLTLPCVTGPYVNVGATLSLRGSRMRVTPDLEAVVEEVPLRHTTTIATSGAQNDAGVFEFSFRDERYMPFEGAGAISDWHLELPANFRAFDYDTITDVILRMAYTAETNRALKGNVEAVTATSTRAIRTVLTTRGIRRMFSVRHDFPILWRALTTSPPGTAVPFELSLGHLPFLVSTWPDEARVTSPKITAQVTSAIVYLGDALAGVVPTVQFSLTRPGGAPVSTAAAPPAPAWTVLGGGYFEHAFSGFSVALTRTTRSVALGMAIDRVGNVAPTNPPPGSRLRVDDGKLRDVLLLTTIMTASS